MKLSRIIESLSFDLDPRYQKEKPPWNHARHTAHSEVVRKGKHNYYRKYLNQNWEAIDRIAKVFTEVSVYNLMKYLGIPVPRVYGFTVDKEGRRIGVFTSLDEPDSRQDPIADTMRQEFFLKHSLIFYLIGHVDRNFQNFIVGNKKTYAIDFEQAYTFTEDTDLESYTDLIAKLLQFSGAEANHNNIMLVYYSIKRYRAQIESGKLLEIINLNIDKSLTSTLQYYKSKTKDWDRTYRGPLDFDETLHRYVDKIKSSLRTRYEKINSALQEM